MAKEAQGGGRPCTALYVGPDAPVAGDGGGSQDAQGHGPRVGGYVLRESCLQTYVAWHRGRLEQILRWLASLDPPPNLVVLPEGAVPWQCLATVHDFAASSDCIVVAGTHSFQKMLAARRAYRGLGVSETRLRNLWKRRRSWPTSFAVVITPGKSIMLEKRALSPFEMTDSVSPDFEMPTLQARRFKSTRYEDTLLVGICAEVLRIHNVTEPYSGVAIASYQKRPSHFGSAAKARFLRELLQKGANRLQHARLLHLADLADRGTDTEDLWDAIGRDCIVAAPGLRNVEAGLAELCHDELVEGLSGEQSLSESTSKTYLDLIRICAGKRRAATPAARGALAFLPARPPRAAGVLCGGTVRRFSPSRRFPPVSSA